MALIFWTVFLILLDQLSKFWVRTNIAGGEPLVIIQNFLSFNYVENRGAAFGLWHDSLLGSWVLKIFSLLLTLLLILILRKLQHPFMRFLLATVIAGSIGNLLDRFFLSYVTDFISFKFANYYFPSFNVADTCIVLGTLGLVLLLLFNEKAGSELLHVLKWDEA